MENRPYFSIIMPVYNAEKYIYGIINNIKKQTFEDWELIIVNDCSMDNSGEICQKYAEKDKRILLINLEQNEGAGYARNRGIEQARGEYITFVDADDEIEPDLYKKVWMQTNKYNVDVVCWGLVEEYFDKKETLQSENRISLSTARCKNSKEVIKKVIELEEKTLFGYQWNKVYKADIIKTYNVRFEKAILYEDYFFNLDVIKHTNSMIIIDECLYHYKKRVNESITNKFVDEYYSLSYRRVESMYELYKEKGLLTSNVKCKLRRILLRYTLSALMRNCDPQAKMNYKERKKWIKENSKKEMYHALRMPKREKALFGLLEIFLEKNMYTGCLLMGRGMYIAKQGIPMVYLALKKTRGNNK